MIISIDQAALDSDTGLLSGPQDSMQLQPLLVEFVIYLASREGQTVSRDELIAEVWNDYPGADQSLTNAVYKLRSALSAVGADKSCLQTVPKRGYRLCSVSMSYTQNTGDGRPSPRLQRWLLVMLTVVTLALIAAVWLQKPWSDQSAQRKSIAVLAFDDLSEDNSKLYLARGLAEQLTTRLARTTDLRVIGRTSSFALSGKGLTVAEIAEKLQVNHILEGSVQSAREHIRINVQLIDVQQNRHLWSQSYDDSTENLFVMQDRIVEDTISAIGAVVANNRPVPEQNIAGDAYEDYLQAKFLATQGSTAAADHALQLLDDLLAEYPYHVPGLTLMSRLQFRRQQFELSRQYLQRALQVDPHDALANSYQAWDELMQKREPRTAAASMRQAVRSEPDNPDVLMTAARFARAIGHQDQAIALAARAVEIDPYCALCLYQLAQAQYHNHDYALAAQTLARYQRIGKGGWVLSARIKVMQQKPEAALAALQRQFPPAAYEPYWLAAKAMALQQLGQDAAYQSVLEKLQPWADREPRALAYVYAWAGDHDRAFELLYSRLDDYFDSLHDHPDLQPLQDDPRWQELLIRAGMADAWVAAIRITGHEQN